MSCEISKHTIANGIETYVKEKMDDSNLFDYKDELFTIKDENSNHQRVVDVINQSFAEELIMKMGSQPIYAIASPSDTLINQYLHASTQYQMVNSDDAAIVEDERSAREKTIRDLATSFAARIGMNVRFVTDQHAPFKGSVSGDTVVINLAHATNDTPIHEILGHPIIKAIKNNTIHYSVETNMKDGGYVILDMEGKGIKEGFKTEQEAEEYANENLYPSNTLYQNLLKELETEEGKKVFDRIKRDYEYKQGDSNLPMINQYGVRLDDFVTTSIAMGLDAEQVARDINLDYLNADGEWMHFNHSGEYAPEFEGDEGPKQRTTIDEVYNLIGIKGRKYTEDEQKEEALVELLGLVTAEKLDKVKNANLISLVKQLLAKIKDFVRGLLKQREIAITDLPDNMTLGDLSDLLAYSNSTIILPGYEVVYTTPDDMKFTTYAEASKHITDLAKESGTEVDLSNIKINKDLTPEELNRIKELEQQIAANEAMKSWPEYIQNKKTKLAILREEQAKIDMTPTFENSDEMHIAIPGWDWARVQHTSKRPGDHVRKLPEGYVGYYKFGYTVGKEQTYIEPITDKQAREIWEKYQFKTVNARSRHEFDNLQNNIDNLQNDSDINYIIFGLQNEVNQLKNNGGITQFLKKNAEYEEANEIIKEWKRTNGIEYDPEEVYSRGQGFYSVVGAYSSFDVNLLFQNLLHHLEDSKKAGGEFVISAYTRPINKKLGHLDADGGKISFRIYPKPQDIKWAANSDVYSGSTWQAAQEIAGRDKRTELIGISYTKAPNSDNLRSVTPNLADIIDGIAHYHNELGIELTGDNFRLEYDDEIPTTTKKLVDNINRILDQKFGKIKIPEVKEGAKVDVYDIYDNWDTDDSGEPRIEFSVNTEEEAKAFLVKNQKYEVEGGNRYNYQKVKKIVGKTPSITRSTLKEKITDVRGRFTYYQGVIAAIQTKDYPNNKIGDILQFGGISYKIVNSEVTIDDDFKKSSPDYKREWFRLELIKNTYDKQAIINLKIARLKEQAKRYPRTLIRSEVRKINDYSRDYSKDIEEIDFQKVPSAPVNENFLKPKDEAQFKRLQEMGYISTDTNTVGGKTYYKVLGDEEQDAVLREIIKDKELDFVHIHDSPLGSLIELGERDEDEPKDISETTSTTSSKATGITKQRVLRFLENIGFTNLQIVNQLSHNGQRLNGDAYVDMLNGIMQIVEGKEDYTLPEEAMHILVELVKQSRPELYISMRSEVINYKLYGKVLNDPAYVNSSFYQTLEGEKNLDKFKDEAIAKLLAEMLINQLEGTGESEKRIVTVYSWWKQILQWIKEKFGGYKNPFKTALKAINEDDTSFGQFKDISSDDIFLSAKTVDQIDKENPETKTIWERIKDKAAKLNIIKTNNEYFRDGQVIPKEKRVSALKDAYYTKLFGKRNFDEAEQAFYDQSAQDGTYLHEIFEEVINSMIDPDTGLMRRNPAVLKFPLSGNPLQGKIVQKSQTYLKNLMALYPEGTRFITEQIIYDEKEDRYGTIDFLAVVPADKITGKPVTVDILDWKSMLIQEIEGVKDYKRGGIFVQINEYTRILKESYGVENMGKIRAIPINKIYKTDRTTKVKTVDDINIGNANPAAIKTDERFLRPIISPEESTGSEVKDILAKKLEALYQKYIEKGYFQTDRSILNDVTDAIYEIRVNNTADSLSQYFIDLRTRFEQFLPEIERLSKGSKEDISEAAALSIFYIDIIKNIVKPSINLKEDKTIKEESRNALVNAAASLSVIENDLNKSIQKLLDSLARQNGITDLLLPEKIINLFQRWFRSIGSQDIATGKLAYELVKKSYHRINVDTDNNLKQLKQLKYDFDEWRKSKGLSSKDATARLVNFNTGKIHSKISSAFFIKREEVAASRNSKDIINFVKDNYDMTEYTEWYNKTLAENKKVWNASTYVVGDPKKNAQIIKNKINNFEKTYNILSSPVTAFGYHNRKIWGKNIKEELWYSEEYKELLKDENKPLLAMYNYMLEKNKEIAEVGAIKDYQQYTFFPSMRKTFADIASFDDSGVFEKIKDSLFRPVEDFRRKITTSDYEMNFDGARDSFSGEKLEKRFIPYVQGMPIDEKSFDLFTVYGYMSAEVNKEKYLRENDEILRSLVHIERMKPNLLRNKASGKIVKSPSGKVVVGDEIGKNAPVLENFVRAVVNGESLQYDADFVVQFKIREKWNNSPLGKLYHFDITPETYNPTSISATKFIMWMNNANQKRILGLNAASAISNLFGGMYASNRLYKKYLNENDINEAFLKMTSGSFYATEDMKKRAAFVDYFLPFLNNREGHKASQLSVNDAAKLFSQEWLMAPMRFTSEKVQLNIFLAILENTGLVNGKVVNLKELVANEINYYNRYQLDKTKQKEIEKELQTKLKEYKNKYGLLKVAAFKTVKEAGKDKVVIDIPGINRETDESVENFRDIVLTMAKDALGEADEYDLASYKYSIYGRLFMTFKNWIPRQADVRFGEFRYDQAHHSHEYGRFRMFARALTASSLQSIFKLIPAPYITGKIADVAFSKDALIQRAKEVYEQKKLEAKELGKFDEKTFITEGEFVDKFIQGVDSTFAEVRTIILFNLIMFSALMAPDDDDDSEEKAWKALVRRQIDKLSDEVGFFYNPKSAIDVAGGGPPIASFVRDYWYLGTNIMEQFFGFTFEQVGWDEKGLKMQESAKPIKRAFKVFPVLKEILTYLPTVDEETSKAWGVRINDRRGF